MEHLAHERAKGFGVKKPPENAGVRLGIDGELKAGAK